jgi:hypothetical protein
MGNCSSDKSTEVKDSSAPAAAPANDEHQHNEADQGADDSTEHQGQEGEEGGENQ